MLVLIAETKGLSEPIMEKLEKKFEHLLFSARWLMAPVYFGLVLAMILMLVKFFKEIVGLLVNIMTTSGGDLIIGVLSLVDIALIMNLLIIIMFSGYENFVSKMEDLHNHLDRPEWMGHIGFSDLKVKLFGSIVAISGIELLKGFMKVDTLSDRQLAWMVGIHVTFMASGLLYALMDRLHGKAH